MGVATGGRLVSVASLSVVHCGKGIVFEHLLLPAPEWAEFHFGGLDLGDARRDKRAVKVAAAAAADPSAGLPGQAGGDAHQAKAAYRLFSRNPDRVTFDALAGGHRERTRRDMAALPVVLLVGDGTEVDYTAHPGTAGLGKVGDGRGRGMLLHSVLALDEGGRVQGLAWQDLSYRQEAPEGETRSRRRSRDRESQVWSKAAGACGAPAPGRRYVHVCDCGSDDFLFFAACRRAGSDFLSRVYEQRRAATGHEASQKQALLLDLARSLPALGGKVLELRSRKGVVKRVRRPGNRGRDKRSRVAADVPARRAKLLVSSSPVTVFPPWLERGGADGPPRPLRLWVVRVWEVDAPEGVEPVEWVLLTSLPVRDLADALRMAEWYGLRWLIEEYHKCLKTGCRVEKRQLGHADRLEPLLGILTVVAVRLLALKQRALAEPDAPAVGHVSELEVRLLAAERKLRTPLHQVTVRQFWRGVAHLGGFLGRKGDGEPGWQTTWKGWQKLQDMARGARLALGTGPPGLQKTQGNCG